jgi:bacterioferritin-associated ferredoxin
VYVCICHAVTEKDIQKAIANGASSVAMLSESTSLGTRCGHCTDYAYAMISKCGRQCP